LWLVEWRAAIARGDERRSTRVIWLIAWVLAAAVFTRYDGWIITFLAWTTMGIVLLKRGRLRSTAFWMATVIVIAAPVVWLVYNQVVFADWLDFARGPYSAKAIELKTSIPGSGPPHPGWHNPWVSLIFYGKAFEMDTAARGWGNFLLAASLWGTAWGWLIARRKAFAWALLLWVPVPFYAYSVAYGSVPIFLPVWWPHSWYNTRYGLEMLPALAVGVGFAANFLLTAAGEFKPALKRWVTALLFLAIAANTAVMLHQGPLVYVEGTKNAIARRPYERVIAARLRELLAERPHGIVLMDTSVYPHVVALSGIPLQQTVNESDKEFYQAALEAPAQHAAIVMTLAGDAIEQAIKEHPAGLRQVARLDAPGQPAITLYVSDSSAAQGHPNAPKAVVASGKEQSR
jgi:hypothetical protein